MATYLIQPPGFFPRLIRILAEVAINGSNPVPISTQQDIEQPVNGDVPRKETHGEYLWLLIVDLLIFIVLTLTTYSSSKKFSEKSDEFRPQFIKGLMLANGVRALSLVFIIILENSSGNNPSSWFNYVCHVVPAFVFVSAYMYLVTFLADLYYSHIQYSNHIVKPAFLLIVAFSYLILALAALITFVARGFKAFAYISEFLMGLIYLILGTMTIYYGEKVGLIMKDKDKSKYEETNDTIVKLRTISQSIGGLFLLKGLCGILTAMNVFEDFYPIAIGANLWDFLWFLILEIAPTLIFILLARKKLTKPASEDETPRPSDFEMDDATRDSRFYSNAESKYHPPFSN